MRIIDANVNRASEGLRVIEDLLRFYYNEKNISSSIRNVRHNIRKIIDKDLLIISRDITNDIGKYNSFSNNNDIKRNKEDIMHANFSRVCEAIRVIEEILKNEINYDIGKKFEIIRFEIYELELQVAKIKKMDFRKKIYGITNESLSGMTHLEMAYLLLENGIKIIQYRDKEKTKKEKLKDCFEIKKLVNNYSNITFIVNDDVDIACLVDADGVHLGQDDLDLKIVKENFPSLIIGVSTHNREQAETAVKNGADYIGVGPIFNTNTKVGVEKSDGLEFLKWVKDNIKIPYVAIGGINRHNINDVFNYGGNTVAMISELFTDEKIKKIKLEFIRRQNDIYNSDGCS